MGKLEVVFKVGLANPFFLPEKIPELPVTVYFPETGNTVWIEPPRWGPGLDYGVPGSFDLLVLHVERECTDEEGKDTSYINNERLNINRDAGRVFWKLFEAIREIDSLENYVAGYQVVSAETIQSNPLVRRCQAEWIYDGAKIQTLTFGGIASVHIRHGAWVEAARRLKEGTNVPAYRSFGLDACYFATSGDPHRAIVMACAALEVAFREYLSNVAARQNPVYKVIAQETRTIPRLYKYVQVARGGKLFFDEPESKERLEKAVVKELPDLRNRLLHAGKRDLPEGKVIKLALAVLDAMDWLFRDAYSHGQKPVG